MLLGSPGISDATLQLLQACVPHRRLTVTGCESVTFGGRSAVDGPLAIGANGEHRPIGDVAGQGVPGHPVAGLDQPLDRLDVLVGEAPVQPPSARVPVRPKRAGGGFAAVDDGHFVRAAVRVVADDHLH